MTKMSVINIVLHVALTIAIIMVLLPALKTGSDGYHGAKVVDVKKTETLELESNLASTEDETIQKEQTPLELESMTQDTVVESKGEEVALTELTSIESTSMAADSGTSPENEDESALYSVVDSNKLDAHSYAGFKLYRNWCARCHGTYGQGMVGPNLADSLKVISEKEFFNVVENGKSGTIGSMPAWKKNVKVMAGRDQLYAYLMARSDGAIGVVKPQKQ